MKIFFDTEFIENGKTIELISIGMVREDGRTYYAESMECDLSQAGGWVKKNVVPQLTGNGISRMAIKWEIMRFVGDKPEFWAYYCSYDWIVLCQLFGTMMQLPRDWPMYCNDIKQECMRLGNPQLHKMDETKKHNALNDALWCRDCWMMLQHYDFSMAHPQ